MRNIYKKLGINLNDPNLITMVTEMKGKSKKK